MNKIKIIELSKNYQSNKQNQLVLDNLNAEINLTGLTSLQGKSGSGKSTIANIIEQKLHQLGKHTYLLDGDNVRHGLNKDLGFTDSDRVENIRRISEVSKLMVDAGLITIVSFISPFKSERKMARELVEENEFIEIFVDILNKISKSTVSRLNLNKVLKLATSGVKFSFNSLIYSQQDRIAM